MTDPWYKDGVSFKCQGCGGCCYGFPGYVWVTSKDIEKMAAFLKISKEAFIKKYCRTVQGRLSLTELKAPTYACIFLKDKKCAIYEARPFQCKAFPFWTHNFKELKNWEEVQKSCPGAAAKKPHYSFEEIEKLLEAFKKELSF